MGPCVRVTSEFVSVYMCVNLNVNVSVHAVCMVVCACERESVWTTFTKSH